MQRLSKVLLGTLFITLCVVLVYADGPSLKVDVTTGDVKISQDGGKHWQDAYPEMSLSQNDIIKTGHDSTCEMIVSGKGILRVEANSQISIKKLTSGDQQLKVSKGRVLFNIFKKSKKPSFQVETDVAVVAVRGTQFVIDYDGEEEITTGVVEGKVSVKRQVTIPAGLTSPEMEKMLEVEVTDKQEVTMTMTENEYLQNLISKTKKNLPQLKKVLRSNQSETQKKIRMMKNAKAVVDDMRSLDPDQSESATELDSIIDKYKKKQGHK